MVLNSISLKRADFSCIALFTLLFMLAWQFFPFFSLTKEVHAIVVSVSYQLHLFKPADYFSLQGQAFKRGRSNLVLRSESNSFYYQWQLCGLFFSFKHFIQQACLQDSSSWGLETRFLKIFSLVNLCTLNLDSKAQGTSSQHIYETASFCWKTYILLKVGLGFFLKLFWE